MWSLFDMFRRRFTSKVRSAKPKGKTFTRRYQPWAEVLEDRAVPSTSTISHNFQNGYLSSGDTLWFDAVGTVSGVGAYTADVYFTNQTITFSDTLFGTTTNYTENPSNTQLILVPGATSASTTFNTATNTWITTAPPTSGGPTGTGNLFMGGFAMALPNGLGDGDTNVTWSATITTDTSGVNVNWNWGAAPYTSFGSTNASLGIKPCDSSTASISGYGNNDQAGTPESYKNKFTGYGGTVPGGPAGNNAYNGNPPGPQNGNATYVPTFVTLAGTVYNDANNDGTDDAGDAGVSGVTLTLTGTSASGTAVSTTTTTAANGTYSFTTANANTMLSAGTYTITETAPAGFDLPGTDTAGTLGGTVSAQYVINSITLTAAQAGTAYNFGEIVRSGSTQTFVAGAIPSTDTLWFSSWGTVTGVGPTYAADIYVTNQTITITDSSRGTHTYSVPNAELTVVPGGATDTTAYTSANTWLTTVPSNLVGNLFLAGFSLPLTLGGINGLAGGDTVSWAGSFTSDTSGVNVSWGWGAAAYTTSTFGTYTYSTLNVKPSDAIAPAAQKAGAPESATGSFSATHLALVPTGAGYNTDYTGINNPAPTATAAAPTYVSMFVTVSGTVYGDTNKNGIYDAGDTTLSGVTLTLTGTTANGQAVSTTTTTAGNGTYTFSTAASNMYLSPGTYTITESIPVGDPYTGDDVGTVGGTSNGQVTGQGAIGDIDLTNAQTGSNYNFGQFVQVRSSLSQNFTNASIGNNDVLWFSAAATVSGVGALTADVYVTSQIITFSDTHNSVTTNYSLNVPNTTLTLVPGSTAATTSFNSSVGPNGTWTTTAPPSPGVNTGNLFMGGFALALPTGLSGNGDSVTWAATFTTDTSGLTVQWSWGAAVYTSFNTSNYSALNVKPCDSSTASISGYANTDKAGTPEAYAHPTSYVISGGTGSGSPNYTGLVTGVGAVSANATPTYIPTFVTLGGTVYSDVNVNGSYDAGDTGISGVTVTLTGTTTATGAAVNTTTTTNSSGAFSFTTSSGTNGLLPGTYTITETLPSGNIVALNTVGTVNSVGDGSLSGAYSVNGITVTGGQAGSGYNFGEYVPTISSFASSFTATAIAPGRDLWFSAVASVTGVGAYPATIWVKNQTITFSDTKSGVTTNYTEVVPDAQLTVTPGATTGTTTFNSSLGANGTWITNDPSGLSGNLFLSGFEMPLPAGLNGNDNPVTWTGTFTSNTAGLSLHWSFGAAQYTSMAASYSAMNVKPCDNSAASGYGNSDPAGTPEANKGSHVSTGGTSSGSTDYTGMPASPPAGTAVTPRYTPTAVSISGLVYIDTNKNGIYNAASDPGLAGVTLTLNGTTAAGVAITAATTVSNSSGNYQFAVDGNGNLLAAGTYTVVETAPAGYYVGSDTVGTVNGVADGSLVPVDSVGTIILATGQSGVGYNFGEIDPFVTVSPGYPYSSSNPLTNVAFNESEIMAGASVNVATGTFDMFYSDEHAMTLGVSQVVVTAANGTTATTNYNVSSLTSDPEGLTNPAVGDQITTGAQAAVDGSGRPMFPSLYLTDITANANSTAGDWQNGGVAIPPSAIYGTWKSYTINVNQETSPATITESGGNDPSANGWNMPAGADPVPASVQSYNAGYGTEVQWSLSSLYAQGYLIPGHNYRFYFILHDGDQNKSGGDVGQAAFDFDYQGPVTIAGNVYKDVYGNGVDGAGDSGIGGVSLTLTGQSATGGAVSTTTTTAANGTYTFTQDQNGNLLTNGSYTVAVTPPANYLQGYNTIGFASWAPGVQTVLNTVSAAGNSTGVVHEPTELPSGAATLDTNGLGQWHETTGTDSTASTDIEDAFGANFSDSLTGHNFIVAGLDRDGNSASTSAGFWFYQSAISLNANGTFSGIHTNGDIELIVNVTVNGAASVGIYEWTGNDTTGTLTAISPPVGASFVNVNTSPTSVPWSFTDTSGNTEPAPGELVEVGVDLNAIFGLTVPVFNSFMAETRASAATSAALSDFALGNLASVSGSFVADGNLSAGNTGNSIGSIVLADGQNGINYNFGFVQPIQMGGYVYQDTNGSGVYTNSASDPGIPNVTVTLSGTNNLGVSESATAVTNSSGYYNFTTDSLGHLLPPGTYTLTETVPASPYVASAANPGTGLTNAGTASISGPTAGTVISGIVGNTGQDGVNFDFGDYKPVSVAGIVYTDTNGSGVYTNSASDPALVGVTLTLSGTNGKGIAITPITTTTGAGGAYNFGSLQPGTYTITETVPTSPNYTASAANLGTGAANNGTVASAIQISSILLNSAQAGSNFDFGDYLPVSVAGIVYTDSNGSGVYTNSASDPALVGVTLTLSGTDGLGHPVNATTTSGAGGAYSFGTLRPGTYTVTETVPATYTASAATVGTGAANDGTASTSGATAGTVISGIVTTSGQSGVNFNFGDFLPVSVAGIVYTDANGSGVYTNSASDPALVGVTLTLSGTNGKGIAITPVTTTTLAGGAYSFGSLQPGTYTVTETVPTNPNYTASAATVGTGVANDGTASISGPTAGTVISGIVTTSGQNGVNFDFGDYLPVSVAGIVYTDTNGSGVYNSANDPALVGVTLTLSGTNGKGIAITPVTTTTLAGGAYSFGSLQPGTYTVTETVPTNPNYTASAATVGTGAANDGTASISGPTAGTVISGIVTTSGQNGVNFDFGDYLPVNFAGIVYTDTNGSGVYTNSASDPALVGVTLTLTGTDGLGHPVNATTTTGAGGAYSFGTLRPGTYIVTETVPATYTASAANVGKVGASSVGTAASSIQITSIAMTSGQAGINYNFGDYQAVGFSGIAYTDTNGSGVYTNSASDPALVGVTLTLSGTDGLGHPVNATTTSGAGGAYSFGTLRPGTYIVTETVPSTYTASAANVGSLGGTAASTTQISAIALTSGQSGSNYNFGDYQPVGFGGIVYTDTNGSGVYTNSASDPALVGVTLTLSGTDGLGHPVNATTTSGAGGAYSFGALRPGTYIVTETVPATYTASAANVGTVGASSVGTAASTTQISSIALTSGQAGSNYNFGDYQAASFGGIVYTDTNGSGVYTNSASDPALVGVTLTLSGTDGLGHPVNATTTSGGGGAYSFGTLRPGTYIVTESVPATYTASAANVGTVGASSVGTAASTTQITSIALTSNQTGSNYNFGDYQAVSFSGIVYQDTNGSGVYTNSASDPALVGVTLTLTGTDGLGHPVNATTTSGGGGAYSFGTLRPGTYIVTESVPATYTASAANVGKVGASSVGTAASSIQITSIAMTSGQTGSNYNFGDYQAASFAGIVYTDTNGSGVYTNSASDPALVGVTLTLSGADGLGHPVNATTTTSGAGGAYSFGTLRPGTYIVTETVPSTYTASAANVGSLGGTAASTTQISAIALTSGQSGSNYNFGDYQPVGFSGIVYQDTNGSGVYTNSASDPALVGVTLTLSGTDGLGHPVNATTTSGAGGAYSFGALRPGTYIVTETVPNNFVASAANVGAVGATTVGTAASASQITSIVLTSGQAGANYNFGDYHATLAGMVYQDTNGSGAYTNSSSDPALAGVTVTLTGTDGEGNPVNLTTTTGGAGAYGFAWLRPGTYIVTETVPANFTASAANVGTGASTLGTAVSATQITSIVLTSGQDGANYNFADYQPASFAGIVYQDSAGTGVYTNSTSDPGIVGVTLTLGGTDGLGHPVSATTTTGAGGAYSFGALRPGAYSVTETQPSGYLAGATSVGTVGGATDGSVVSSGVIGSIVLTSGQTGSKYNFGDFKAVSFGGTVYLDNNGNGAFDTGEQGISGITLTLSGTNGLGQSITATATTDVNGNYTFSTDSNHNALRPGNYTVTEAIPGGFLAGATSVGTNNLGATDGSVVSTGVIGSVNLTSGQTGSNYDFGDLKAVSIGGTVYQDSNGNGALDAGEPGISGIAVTLNGTNGLGQVIIATATTNASGAFNFTVDSNGNALRPGTYQISETVPSVYIVDGTTVGSVGGTTDGTVVSLGVIGSITETSGQVGSNYLFGDVKPVTLAGTVYQDTNGNGAFDAGEPGIANVTLTLSGTNGLGQSITATATTNSSGVYTFTTDTNGNAIRPGTYQVVETLPSGYLAGTNAVGSVNGSTDGTLVSTNEISSILMASGQTGSKYNFGAVQPVSFGGTVYQDSNGNNVFDASEPGISGVTLTLSGTNGMGQTITATTTTGAGGAYTFTTDSNGNLLRPGTYQVTETQPSGYQAGATSVGAVNSTADGTVVSSGVIGSIALTSGQIGSNYNFGDFLPVSFGGTVYNDANANGILDAGEVGIAGVTMTLKGTNGLGQSITATTTTVAGGAYSFSTDSNGNLLRPGTYQVIETSPAGYVAGATSVGTVNGTADGTVVAYGHIGSIALTSGQTGFNYNFGDIEPVTIIGTVYVDSNGNNRLDAGEPGLSGVTVTLTGTNGLGQTVTATAVTDSNGFFGFTQDSNNNALLPGTYQISETQPSGYLAGATSVGTVNGTADGTLISTGTIGSIVLASGQASINNDFGELKPVTIAGTVYEDLNANGVLDPSEPGMSGVTVTLSGTNGLGQTITATGTTNSSGAFSFTTDSNNNVLRPGTYQVIVTTPAGYIQGTDTIGTVNGTADGSLVAATEIGAIVLTSSQNGINYNFAEILPITLSGEVYFDANANGMLDAGDTGIAGVTLTLTGTTAAGVPVNTTTTTEANGTYSFTTDSNGNLLWPGTYQIAETQPAGYLQGINAVGTINGATDGSLVPTDKIGSIVATPGENGFNYNFGEVTPITLGGTVYQDSNLNQVIAAGDPGISGVTLTLSGVNNLGVAVTATAISTANGGYAFTTDSNSNLLAPGSYQITETPPANDVQIAANVGTVNGATDGTAQSAVAISSIVVVSGQNGISYNFGLVPQATIAGTVYVDLNRDFVLDTGDSFYPGEPVFLTGTNLLGQTVSLSTSTDVNGNYSFSGLLPGTYSITVAHPFGIYNPEVANVGTVSGASDGVANASDLETDQIVLSVGAAGINYDFGFWRRIIA